MRVLGIVVAVVAAALLAVAALLWGTSPSAGPGQMRIAAKTPFTMGHYYLYVQPWGGESYAPTRPWAAHADAAVVDLNQFPSNTLISWRWPPFVPRNDVGVWAYNALSYGSYDGGAPEKPVPAIKVRDLKVLAQGFRWTLSNRFGDANVLTELYLDPPVVPVTAHKVEIGFFLHVPDNTRLFFESVPEVGVYADERGHRWKVHMGGTFCMFAPEGYQDVPVGSIDMLRALRWLETKKVVSGDEVMPGLAFGLEAVKGFGQLRVNHWQVVMK